MHIIAILLLVQLAIMLTACETRIDNGAIDIPPATAVATATVPEAAGQTAASRLDSILEKGEIVVAMSPDFAPMEFIDSRKNGQEQYVGADPWFAKYIADELGVQLRISVMGFNSLENALISGEVDLIISGFAATENRAATLELSDYYNIVSGDDSGLIVLKDTTGDYQTAASFNGKTVAVQTSTLQYSLLREQLPDAMPEPIAHINDGVKLLLTKKAEALVVDGANGQVICENYPDLAMSGFKFESPSEGNVVCMKKGEIALRARINEIIAKATAEDLFSIWLQGAKELAAEIGWQD